MAPHEHGDLDPARDELARFFTLSLDLLCIAGFDGVFRRLNPVWERTLGYTVEELCARPFVDFVHPDDREATVAEASRLMTGVPTVSFQNRYRCKDGSYRWLLWCSSVSMERGLFYAAARDITELKETQDALVRSKEAAEAANRAKSEFLAHMSHELKTPLSAILGFARLMATSPAPRPEEEHVFLARIAENGRHLLRLIDGLLDLARIEAGRVELTIAAADLAALVEDVASQFQARLQGRDVRLVSEVPLPLLPIETDAARLRQVLLNLLDNALKFTPRGSVTLRVTADAAGRPLAVAVADTGIGIPEERRAAIFEAFEQADTGTSRRYGGTGLGLTIARSLCDRLGCRLTLESEVGRGTTFTVTLPQAMPTPSIASDEKRIVGSTIERSSPSGPGGNAGPAAGGLQRQP